MLRDKDIPAWVDYWGTDVNHDWPWWHKQLKYFMGRWLDDDAKDPARLKLTRLPYLSSCGIIGIGQAAAGRARRARSRSACSACAGTIRSAVGAPLTSRISLRRMAVANSDACLIGSTKEPGPPVTHSA